jgi:hypothetical protein
MTGGSMQTPLVITWTGGSVAVDIEVPQRAVKAL